MQSTKESEHNILFNYLDTAASIFLVINTKGTVELVNKKGCEILGYSREEIEGRNWFTHFIPKDERTALNQLFNDIVEGRLAAPDSYENTIVAKGGELKLIRWRNSLLKEDNGLVKGLISSGVDITKETNAHATLFLRNRALEAAGNGIIIADAKSPDLPIIYCNSAFTKLTGYEESEVLGKNCRFLQNDDRDQEAIVTMAKAIQKGEACRVVVRNYRKDGSLFWNEVSIRPLHDANHQLTHFIGVQNDVTEIQEAKRKLEQYASTLEDKVAVRTKEIAATVEQLVAANLNLEDQIMETRQAEEKAQQGHALFAAIAKNFPKGVIVVFNKALELTYIEGEELRRISKKKSDFEGKHIDDIPLLTAAQIKTIKKEIIATLNGKSLSLETVYQNNTYSIN
ncbi:MAG: PAS domain-containing protein, partial [Flavobacteriaceae bacterium]